VDPHPPPEQRAVVVTGASSGIGAATARQLAALGHPVALGARRVERCEQLAAEIAAGGGRAEARPLDLADAASVDRFAAEVADLLGPVEVLVSCAGDVLPSSAVSTDPGDFARQVQVNLLGAQRLVSALTPAMIARRRGDVVFVTSDVVRLPRPSMASYVSSKWGLEGLARAMQMELEGTGVRASIVRPGPTLTGMGSGWDPAEIAPVLEEWRRWGLIRHDGYLDAEGVAAAVVAVVSTPRGTHLTLVEVEPEAPVSPGA
jgi:NAD(P)-dependent dehydrogenase (short-subunit alcohol dehydrogenase family)